ncbi:WPE palindromic element domain-containing protein [Wolbachia endosymbiont of Drosophila nikananu]|nr:MULTISPECIES: WPE palindromic element domain-containing protein [Wolbachia]MDE5061458.1 WPE palindromic element domain-containing protein [Wolbachia endosymbiont of Drosophila nikananu]
MPRHWDPEDLILTKWLHNKGWIPVSSTGMTLQGHWDDIILFSGFQTGMTAVLCHTAAVSLDPAAV